MRTISASQLRLGAYAGTDLERLRQQATFYVNIAIADAAIRLCFDDEQVADVFSSRYREHRTGAAKGFDYYIARDTGMYVFWSETSPLWTWDHCLLTPDAVAFLTDAVFMSALIRKDKSFTSLHGAAICSDGVVAAVIGDSTAGKTTTAIACARRGMRFLSDERVLLHKRTVMPFLRTMNIRSGGLRLLATDQVDDLCGSSAGLRSHIDSDWENVSIVDLFGSQAIAAPGPLQAVFLLSEFRETPIAQEITPLQTMPALMRWLDCQESGFARIERVLDILKGVKCYRLYPGKPDATAREIACIAAALQRQVQRSA